MAFKKGCIPWNKGVKYTDELKLRLNTKGLELGRGYFKGKKTGYIPKSAYKKGQLAGNKHPNWKGGISKIDYLERRRFQREMQKLVFERDNYTCQLCGTRGVDLQVDHIQSWADYIELRFSMDNCRTLCAKCHYKITFGKPMPLNIKGFGHNLMKGGRLP